MYIVMLNNKWVFGTTRNNPILTTEMYKAHIYEKFDNANSVVEQYKKGYSGGVYKLVEASTNPETGA